MMRFWPLFILIALSLVCAGVPFFENILGRETDTTDLATRFLPPSTVFWLGTDELGRDLFLRLLEGGRISLAVGLGAALISVFIGTAIGMYAGYYGGRTDAFLMRLTDIMLALPALPLLIILSAVDLQKLGIAADSTFAGIAKIVFLVCLFGWMGVARLARARTLEIASLDFIRASRALGVSHTRIIHRHILPNILGTVIVAATLAAGHIILLESVLSFLGLGIQPPAASWGNMLTRAEDHIWEHPLLMIWPGLMIFLTVLCFNLTGDLLQDKLDPKSKKRR